VSGLRSPIRPTATRERESVYYKTATKRGNGWFVFRSRKMQLLNLSPGWSAQYWEKKAYRKDTRREHLFPPRVLLIRTLGLHGLATPPPWSLRVLRRRGKRRTRHRTICHPKPWLQVISAKQRQIRRGVEAIVMREREREPQRARAGGREKEGEEGEGGGGGRGRRRGGRGEGGGGGGGGGGCRERLASLSYTRK